MSHAISGIGHVLFGKKPPPPPLPTAPASRVDAALSVDVNRATRSTRVSSGSGEGVVTKKRLGSGIFLG